MKGNFILVLGVLAHFLSDFGLTNVRSLLKLILTQYSVPGLRSETKTLFLFLASAGVSPETWTACG